MYDNGFIKIYRKLRRWGWYSDVAVKCVFLHLLIIATWEESEFLGMTLKPGDCVISIKNVADETGLTPQRVRTALKKLESTGEITRKSTNRFTVITVENWATYQGYEVDTNKRATNEQQTDNKRATNEQQHIKKDKKEKNRESKNNNPPNPPSQGGRRKRINEDELPEKYGTYL